MIKKSILNKVNITGAQVNKQNGRVNKLIN